jgi:hypothetical protein
MCGFVGALKCRFAHRVGQTMDKTNCTPRMGQRWAAILGIGVLLIVTCSHVRRQSLNAQLLDATYARDLGGMRSAIEHGADANQLFKSNWRVKSLGDAVSLARYWLGPKEAEPLFTLLTWAVRGGDAEMAQLLLSEGADPDLKDGHNKTPLQWARQSLYMPRFGYWERSPDYPACIALLETRWPGSDR